MDAIKAPKNRNMTSFLLSQQSIFVTLDVGSKGPPVTLLQSYLLLLRTITNVHKEEPIESIPPSELATATFGGGTRLAVLEFQKDNHELLTAQPSGVVNQETATVLQTKLLKCGLDWNHPKVLFVAGSVRYVDGSPGSQLSVTISDRDLSQEKLLATTTVTSDGFFAAQYSSESYLRASSGRRPALVPRVLKLKEVIYSPNVDQIVYNAPVLALIDIALTQRAPSVPTGDMFTQVVSSLDSVLPPAAKGDSQSEDASIKSIMTTSLGKIIDPNIGNRIIPLREDANVQDISYLTRTKPTTFTTTNLTSTILAYRMSNVAATQHSIQIPPEFLYGLLATNTNQNFVSHYPSNIGSADVSLQTPPDQLLYQFGLLDDSIISKAISDALQKNLVSQKVNLVDVTATWKNLHDIASNWIILQPTMEDYMWTLIQDFLSTGKEEAVRQVLNGGNIDGDLQDFFENLQVAFSTHNTTTTLSVAATVSKNEVPSQSSSRAAMRELIATHTDRELAAMDHSTLTGLVESNIQGASGTKVSSDDVQRIAREIGKESEKKFPTAVFTSKLRSHIESASKRPTALASLAKDGSKSKDVPSPEPVRLGHQALAIDAVAVASFLEANPDFDLHTSKLTTERLATTPDDTIKKSIAAVQRVFKLAPTFDKTQALLDIGVHSAANIARMSRPQFVKTMSNNSSFSAAEATQVFNRAADVHLATALLVGDLHGARNAMLLAGVSEPVPPEKLDSITKDFPDIAKLFEIGDVCACSDCMTVYSPSAYLVDVLEFLRYRGVLDSVGGPNNGQMARDVLFKRRPDLADLDLSCNNTNVTLPFIDLACELLEDFVAPDGLSPGSFSGVVDKGKISPSLLGFLRDSSNLPFSENAIVSDTYNSGYRTVRDSSVVVSLSPGAQAVRVLRQTYLDATTLVASPAYVNAVAYDRLSKSKYLPRLPFNFTLEECRGFLNQLGVPRPKLMKDLYNGAPPYNIALEELKLSWEEGLLITSTDVPNQDTYWNTGNITDPASILKVVTNFINTARIEYTDLQALLNATEWLNPPAQPPPNSGVQKVGVMYIRHTDNTCSLTAKEIEGLDNTSLDRFHRFIRLWKAAASVTQNAWTISSIDRTIGAGLLGAGNLGTECVSKITAVVETSKLLSSKVPTTVDDVIDLFTILRLVAPDETISSSTTTYSSLFLNSTANGPVNPAFQIKAIAMNDSSTPPTVIPKLTDYVDDISRSLGAISSDINLVIVSVTATVLSIANLSAIYAVVSLSRRIGLSVPDYYLLIQLSKLKPLEDLDQLKQFVEVAKKLQTLNLAVSEVQFLIKPPTNPPSSIDIADARITGILTDIQKQYSTIEAANQSPYDDSLLSTENENTALPLVSQIPGVSQTDLVQFRTMFEGGLSVTAGAAMIKDKLKPTIGAAASNDIATAQSNLASNPSDATLRNALVKVVSDTLTSCFATTQRIDVLKSSLSSEFSLSTDMTKALFDGITSLRALQDAKLATGAVSNADFPLQFQCIRLVFRLAFILSKFTLSAANVSWLLRNASSLGWASPADFPTQRSMPAITWDSWLALLDYLATVTSATFPDVQNLADKTSPFTLSGLFSLVLNSGTDIPAVESYFCSLSSYDAISISALVGNFGFTVETFKNISTIRKLDAAATTLRKSNIEAKKAISLATAQVPSRDDAAAARDALKLRYLVDSDWLSTLKTINDPLRLKKRDSLVDYLIAHNKPNITSSTDLSEILLIDVEMGTETLTSRIIQAHQSIQQFVQRLKMGLEPTPILADDPSWAHWPEMSQYRLWEANKKVFLYTENWIEPDLRDNKSELYTDVESKITQQPITATSVELAVSGYLQSLDNIAYLEVMSTFYDTPSKTMHVFARTKGGNPREYYHRTLQLETVWTPWEHVDGVEIAGNHVTSFLRNNRLTLVWPIFSYEPNPEQLSTPPQYPDPNNLKNTDGTQKRPDPREQRLVVQLAISEKNTDTGKWSPKLLTEDGVYWPPGGAYVPATPDAFPDTLEDKVSLNYWDFGGNLGQTIVVGINLITDGFAAGIIFGGFNITGCKGYPEPYNGSGLREPTLFAFRSLPMFRSTQFLTERFIKDPALPVGTQTDLAIQTIFDGGQFSSILGNEQGKFVVTYPTQPTILDRFFVALQMYTQGLGARRTIDGEISSLRSYTLTQGTFLPYFVTDSSTRSYAITPGYSSANQDDANFRTASATFDFFNRVIALALKNINVYFNVVNKDITELRKRVNADDEYKDLKTELLNVYLDATNPRSVKLRKTHAEITSFYHPLVCFLRSQLYSSGIDGLLARKTQLQVTDFDFNKTYAPTDYVEQPYPREDLDFSLSGPYSDYNWELFFHLPFEIAARFSADQQFEKAQDWYQYIFNPVGADMEDPDTGPDRATAPQKKYWQTQPFFRMQVKDYIGQRIDSIHSEIANDPKGLSLANTLKTQVQLWRTNPYSPHVIARIRPVAYQLCIVVKYVQNLLDWGDNLFRQLTRETITQASTLYTVADKLLGPKPKIVQPAVPVPVRTYNELGNGIDIIGNALLSLENLVPDLGSLPHGGKELPQPPNPPLTSLYFGIPPNVQMLQLWDLVADRLFKIRNSQDINGNFISLALTSPPIDPGALVRAVASGASVTDIMSMFNAPLPHYRFQYVLERAQVMTQHVIELGQQLLSALEKRDAEGLARLRATSEVTILTAVRNVKTAAITQNAAAVKALQAARVAATDRQIYYNNLLKAPISPEELLSIVLNLAAIDFDERMASGHSDASIMNLAPTFSIGMQGFGGSPQASVSWGGSNLAAWTTSKMSSVGANRSAVATEAVIFATFASFYRRTAEWAFQAQLATDDIAHIDAQVTAANASGAMLQAELDAHDTNAAESATALAYLQNKYTNTELYQWAIGRVSGLYSQAYQQSFSMAKKAEQCMVFELGDFSNPGAIIQYGYWDSLRSGLLAGADLQIAVDRLQTAYTDRNFRELELTKPISLAQVDPIALLNLRTNGSCMFSLPESLFDLDYPGHYFRRTKSITISVPCVVGPYTTVSATLRLLSSRYRAKTTGATPTDYPETTGGDTRFVYNVVPPPTMTAASTAANDSGVFELRMHGDDPRYLPFEHAGVLGTYSLTLPPSEQFPYASIADAVLTISYTARDGGSALRNAATPVPTSGMAAVSLRSAFPADWNALKAGRTAKPVLVGAVQVPHWATSRGRTVQVGQTAWCAVAAAGANLDGVVLVVAGQELALTKDSTGAFWKASLPANAVVFKQAVSIAWKNVDDRTKVDEITCVLSFDVKSPAATRD